MAAEVATGGPGAGQHPVVRVGCAGWSIPREYAAHFPGGGTHLERYARALGAVEINSSFYRPHRRETYERWAASSPAGFRFSVKVPREITHTRRLRDAAEPLRRFLDEVHGLGAKLGPLLIQLPPSLAFEPAGVEAFLEVLRAMHEGAVACEPRHRSWFAGAAERLLERYDIARVAADPALVPAAAEPGGWQGLAYHRLHGSPKVYYSAYSQEYLEALAARLREGAARETWCIFDNTAAGAAAGDALRLVALLGRGPGRARRSR